MLLKKRQLPILFVNLVYISIFGIIFLSRKNYEFVGYVGLIVIAFFLVLYTNRKVNYPNFVLWGLTLWGILHMSGGGIILKNGDVLYKLILIPISESYGIFRYDQFVHIVGFAVATLLIWVLLKPLVRKDLQKWTSLSIIIVMAGFGVGAFNEMIEFLATVFVEETGVGGYINTSLDLVSDLIGAILALIYIRIKKGEI